MKPLIREAVSISKDFGAAAFVGAIAVMLHAGEQRQSQNLGFVVAEQITTDGFLDKGCKIDQRRVKKYNRSVSGSLGVSFAASESPPGQIRA